MKKAAYFSLILLGFVGLSDLKAESSLNAVESASPLLAQRAGPPSGERSTRPQQTAPSNVKETPPPLIEDEEALQRMTPQMRRRNIRRAAWARCEEQFPEASQASQLRECIRQEIRDFREGDD
ncbi:MAG: hypothetical protein EA369_07015 [Bradymonadales bacterium]|nr:MAG: hypothetical protein EA369_07015 [Bradymonadales bacterium]